MNEPSMFDLPMRTTEYLEFYLVERKPKTNVYSVMSRRHGTNLGVVKWYPSWRQYAFFPSDETVFNAECLENVEAFLVHLMEERK